MKVIEIVRLMFEKRANKRGECVDSGINVPHFQKGDMSDVNKFRGVSMFVTSIPTLFTYSFLLVIDPSFSEKEDFYFLCFAYKEHIVKFSSLFHFTKLALGEEYNCKIKFLLVERVRKVREWNEWVWQDGGNEGGLLKWVER